MPTLLDLQTAFRNDLLALEPARDATALIAGDGLEPAERLQIHRNHIFSTLTDTLSGIFPAVEAMVGVEFFSAAAHQFVAASPPTEPMLFGFGEEFREFLADFPPAAAIAVLPELARLEWAMHASFHAADADTLTPDGLASVPAGHLPELCLPILPSTRLLTSAWPVAELWSAVLSGHGQAVEAVDLTNGGCHVLIGRHNGDVRLWAVPSGEGRWLAALAHGHTLGEAVGIAAAHDPAFDLASVLTENLARGVFASLSDADHTASIESF